jgi:hypothetical protein
MTTIKCKNLNEIWDTERELKRKGYSKIADCMWVLIFQNDNEEIAVERDF